MDEQKPEPTESAADSPVEQAPAEDSRIAERIADREVEKDMARRTRRSLLVGGLAALGGFGAWEWVHTRREDNGAPWPLRRALDTNEEIARDYFRSSRRARKFPLSQAVRNVRTNGDIGLDDPVDLQEWRLAVQGADVDDDEVSLRMDEIRKLPYVEQVTELNCIEGWTQKAHWGGARFVDFAKLYPAPDDCPYVGLETPDGEYYVGLDLASAMQPETLLAYELNREPLTAAHGSPLRLAIPTKYGIKNLKRIGKIFYSQERPRDYWAEQGYDWYAGL